VNSWDFRRVPKFCQNQTQKELQTCFHWTTNKHIGALKSQENLPSTKSNSWVRGFFVLVLLLLSLSISAQITTIWLEDFSGVPDTETIDDGSYTPLNTAWSVDNSACTINGGDYSWIISNEFRAGDNDGEAVWTNTGTIDISGYSNANITVDLFENGNNSGDYVEVYYRLDGGPEIQLTNGNQTGNFTSVVASVYGLSGSTLQIVVE
jgi:hypothetical protein